MAGDKKTFAAMVSGFLAFLCGLGLIIAGFAEAHRANAIKDWSLVEAHISTDKVDDLADKGRVLVGYDYLVTGVAYHGSFFGRLGENVEATSRRFKNGSPLEVYVNPRLPMQSALPVDKRKVLIILASGLSLLMLSYLLLRLVFKRAAGISKAIGESET